MQVIKRNNQLAEFKPDKIYDAIKKAYLTVYSYNEHSLFLIMDVVNKVSQDIAELGIEKIPIHIIQSFIEQRLLDKGLIRVLESYMDYRLQRDIDRYGYGDQINVMLHLERIK